MAHMYFKQIGYISLQGLIGTAINRGCCETQLERITMISSDFIPFGSRLYAHGNYEALPITSAPLVTHLNK